MSGFVKYRTCILANGTTKASSVPQKWATLSVYPLVDIAPNLLIWIQLINKKNLKEVEYDLIARNASSKYKTWATWTFLDFSLVISWGEDVVRKNYPFGLLINSGFSFCSIWLVSVAQFRQLRKFLSLSFSKYLLCHWLLSPLSTSLKDRDNCKKICNRESTKWSPPLDLQSTYGVVGREKNRVISSW